MFFFFCLDMFKYAYERGEKKKKIQKFADCGVSRKTDERPSFYHRGSFQEEETQQTLQVKAQTESIS